MNPLVTNPAVDAGDLSSRQEPEHHPRTVHLPPKEVQEQGIKERQHERDEARREKQSDGDKANGGGLTIEPPSSPSSTVDAWSNATPMPVDPSPVTSADEETAADPHRLKELRPPDEQAAIEEHDRLLDAQKELARRQALGDDTASPDEQLRLEEEQAAKATRDAVSKSAASDAPPMPSSQVGASRPGNAPRRDSMQAPPAQPSTPETPQLAQPTPAADDGDTITVRPRPLPPPARPNDTTKRTSGASAATETPKLNRSSTSNSERMTTRVSSGALRHKSVSELIADSSKNTPLGHKRASAAGVSEDLLSPKSMLPPTRIPEPEAQRQYFPKDGAKQQPSIAGTEYPRNLSAVVSGGYAALKGAAEDPTKDYLEPLFRMQINDAPHGKPLGELLHKATKAVSTADQTASLHERQDYRILKRIYQLQNANRWSLRQMERCAEPTQPRTHMDYLLAEAKWMRTDFREERKSKKASAKYFAERCAEWVNADPATRQALQVRIKLPQKETKETGLPHSPAETNGENGEPSGQIDGVPELDPSNTDQDESSVEDSDAPRTPCYAVVPSSIFKVANITETTYRYHESDEFLKAINELPLYVPFPEEDPSVHDRSKLADIRIIPSVSKFCEGKIMAKQAGVSKKRSRYDYEDDEETLSLQGPHRKRARASKEQSRLPPEQSDVALFDPENKHIRDRLHANTAFRPPSEFAMPSTQFYEFRVSSQWIWEDDQKLRKLAKQYSFNWSLIADEMKLPSGLRSAAERRTPWECFERWVELETLPNEMRKTVYFKTWGQRLEAAQRNVDARFQAQLAQQAQTPGQPQPPMRRRTQPMRVERRRNNRYLHLVDAMRKLARKREQHAHKQAEGGNESSINRMRR